MDQEKWKKILHENQLNEKLTDNLADLANNIYLGIYDSMEDATNLENYVRKDKSAQSAITERGGNLKQFHRELDQIKVQLQKAANSVSKLSEKYGLY